MIVHVCTPISTSPTFGWLGSQPFLKTGTKEEHIQMMFEFIYATNVTLIIINFNITFIISANVMML